MSHDAMKTTLAVMLQNHIAQYGPLPDELGDTARAALSGDLAALLPLVRALAAIEEASS